MNKEINELTNRLCDYLIKAKTIYEKINIQPIDTKEIAQVTDLSKKILETRSKISKEMLSRIEKKENYNECLKKLNEYRELTLLLNIQYTIMDELSKKLTDNISIF